MMILILSVFAGHALAVSPSPTVPPAIWPKRGSAEATAAKARVLERLRLFKGLRDKSGPAPDGTLELLGVTAGKSTMVDVEKILGKTVSVTTGDGADTQTSKCYYGTSKAAVIFASDEMISGVGGIEIYNSRKMSGRGYCSKSGKINNEIKTAAGIGLGTKKSEVHKNLGKPGKSLLEYDVYSWVSPLSEHCQQIDYYIVQYDKERVISLQFGRHDSC